MEPIITTSAGKETATQTVARVKAQMAAGGGSPSSPSTTTSASNPVLEALVSRLTQQGQGISTSASSNLQASINEAISNTQVAGNLKSQALESERQRELGFAKDRAGATLTNAIEGGSGYGRLTAGLRELTDTTEKSVRDLDKRYQEAILSNDSATAQRIADLQVKKLEFQQEQEQNFFQNMFSAANLQEAGLNRMMQTEQFWATKEQRDVQFTAQMKQSDYQFEKNLGIQYSELELSKQRVQLEAERNNISRAELNAKLSEIESEKRKTMVAGQVFGDLRNEVMKGGKKVEDLDPAAYALYAVEAYAGMNPEVTFEDYFMAAQVAKSEYMTQGLTAPAIPSAPRVGGLFGSGGIASSVWNTIPAPAIDATMEAILGKKQSSSW